MEPNFQTSFIPKKPMIETRAAPKRAIGPFMIVAVFIFLSVAIASGGLYLYRESLKQNLAKMKSDLNIASNSFEPAKITQLGTLDKRLSAAKEVLGEHVAISPVFQMLESLTLKTIRFTDFSYSLAEDKSGKILVKMSGLGVGYRSIALEADLLTKNKNLINPVFSNLSLDEKGNVLFDLNFMVDPGFVNYEQIIKTNNSN